MPVPQNPSKDQTSAKSSSPHHGSVQWSEIENSLHEIKQVFGFVPSFTKNVVDPSLPGAWAEIRNMRFDSHTALDVKLKGLIGVAVAAQIPCNRISYFDQTATAADGATEQEQLEAVMMAAVTRHWSTVLNGAQLDKAEFKTEVDKIMAYVKNMMEESHGEMPPPEMFLVKPTTAAEAYKDIEQTLGFVPKFFQVFPKEGIAGAWSEFKGMQLNPYTALDGKQKELIGLAVAAQIPCDYCITFHKKACALNGGSEREMQEAIGLAALTRHWSALLHGPNIDLESFKKDADQMIHSPGERH